MYIYTASAYIHTYIYIYIYICMYIYVCIYVYIYINSSICIIFVIIAHSETFVILHDIC